MKEAIIVIEDTQEALISANQVKHSDYSRIFLCPLCNAVLHLRSGHNRNGSWVEPTFVHPEGDISDCEKRVSFSTSSLTRTLDEIISKGQSSKKLEQAFLKCSMYFELKIIPKVIDSYYSGIVFNYLQKDMHLEKRISFNREKGRVVLNPKLLIESCSRVIRSKQANKFFLNELKKLELELLSNEKSLQFFSVKHQIKSADASSFIKIHCKQIEKIIKYLTQDSNGELVKSYLEMIIFGHPDLFVPINNIWDSKDFSFISNSKKFNSIRESSNISITEIEKIFQKFKLNINLSSLFLAEKISGKDDYLVLFPHSEIRHLFFQMKEVPLDLQLDFRNYYSENNLKYAVKTYLFENKVILSSDNFRYLWEAELLLRRYPSAYLQNNDFIDNTFHKVLSKQIISENNEYQRKTDSDSKRLKRVELLNSFDIDLLMRIFKDPKYLHESFSQFYENNENDLNKFILFILSEFKNSIFYNDWSVFPNFYI